MPTNRSNKSGTDNKTGMQDKNRQDSDNNRNNRQAGSRSDHHQGSTAHGRSEQVGQARGQGRNEDNS
jgi:hypothetical protein